MTRLTILVSALVAASVFACSARAQSVETSTGVVFTLLPSSFRSYENVNRARQVDALFNKTQPEERVRIGATGCGAGQGEIAYVDIKGRPTNEVLSWSVEGDRAYDAIARLLCGLQRGGGRSGSVGSV